MDENKVIAGKLRNANIMLAGERRTRKRLLEKIQDLSQEIKRLTDLLQSEQCETWAREKLIEVQLENQRLKQHIMILEERNGQQKTGH